MSAGVTWKIQWYVLQSGGFRENDRNHLNDEDNSDSHQTSDLSTGTGLAEIKAMTATDGRVLIRSWCWDSDFRDRHLREKTQNFLSPGRKTKVSCGYPETQENRCLGIRCWDPNLSGGYQNGGLGIHRWENYPKSFWGKLGIFLESLGGGGSQRQLYKKPAVNDSNHGKSGVQIPGSKKTGFEIPDFGASYDQKTFRYLWRFYSLLFRGFFVALFSLEKQCSGLFRDFFVVFWWLFRGPRFGQILRVLALEQSSDMRWSKLCSRWLEVLYDFLDQCRWSTEWCGFEWAHHLST